jgi:hypothetical protein
MLGVLYTTTSVHHETSWIFISRIESVGDKGNIKKEETTYLNMPEASENKLKVNIVAEKMTLITYHKRQGKHK